LETWFGLCNGQSTFQEGLELLFGLLNAPSTLQEGLGTVVWNVQCSKQIQEELILKLPLDCTILQAYSSKNLIAIWIAQCSHQIAVRIGTVVWIADWPKHILQ